MNENYVVLTKKCNFVIVSLPQRHGDTEVFVAGWLDSREAYLSQRAQSSQRGKQSSKLSI